MSVSTAWQLQILDGSHQEIFALIFSAVRPTCRDRRKDYLPDKAFVLGI
jgi:hypothetical protein